MLRFYRTAHGGGGYDGRGEIIDRGALAPGNRAGKDIEENPDQVGKLLRMVRGDLVLSISLFELGSDLSRAEKRERQQRKRDLFLSGRRFHPTLRRCEAFHSLDFGRRARRKGGVTALLLSYYTSVSHETMDSYVRDSGGSYFREGDGRRRYPHALLRGISELCSYGASTEWIFWVRERSLQYHISTRRKSPGI